MTVHGGLLRVSTAGHGAILDITAGVQAVVERSGVRTGLVCVFVTGSTAAITTMEFEAGGVADLQALLERLVPVAGDYEHNARNADTNAAAHLRAAVVGPSESVPLVGGALVLGTWQQIVLCDFDERPRDRAITVQVLGE